MSKQTRKPFMTTTLQRATTSLEVLYSDVCGPIEVPTIGGKKYFVSFIDEFSKKMWVYSLDKKSEVLTVFEKFKRLVEKESGHSIKFLRTDGGGEYSSVELKMFCETRGISHEITPPYTPQHNGLAKRRNKTIMNTCRTILKGKGVPQRFWSEAVNTAAYILNRAPIKKLDGITPEERCSGIKPSVAHLKNFGSLSYVHVADQKKEETR
jgi:transposase InsO family protein